MRGRIRAFQMELFAGLAGKLRAVPEADGTMLDNTLIVFLSDAGSQHHTGYENMPLLVLGNMNKAFRTGRRQHEIMSAIAADLTDAEIREIADWYAQVQIEITPPD